MNLLAFEHPLATRCEFTGGKGANLALLTQRGFSVPPGFVVTAQTYREFAAVAREQFRAVKDFDFQNPARLRDQCDQLRSVLRGLPLPSDVVAEVRAQLALHPVGQAFSVRSSSTMEDLASAAFAGQHDTYLNITGAEAILERIQSCFLSLWQDRAVAYRHQHGFDHALAAMAVVVQRMVQCDVAGVGFSINPVSGDLGELVVDANFGLGESVVSGEGEVDHWQLDKATRTVRCATIATKSRKVVAVAGGTAEVHIAANEAGQPSLSPAQLSELAALLVRVEESYRFPQDIEWGFADGQLHLLQARPITTIPPRWTREESAERFPNPIAPLTWDFVENGFHRSLAHSFRLMGLPPCHGKWFAMHGQYIYGNQNVVDLYLKRTPFSAGSLPELVALLPQLREEFRWVQELPVAWMRDLDTYLVRLGEFLAEPLERRDLRGLWDFVLALNEVGANYFQPNIAISITHSTLHHLLHRLLKLTCGADAERLFDGLMAFCETKTGTINKELVELAQMVRATPELAELFAAHNSRQLVEQRALAAFPTFEARFAKFLRDHGHRELDFDMYQPQWVEVPWIVLDNVRVILQSPMEITPAQQERELKVRAQQAEFELFSRLPREAHFFFHEVLRLARTYTSLDDLEHYQTTRLTLPVRKVLRELGTRLVQRGVLTEPMDIFFARWAQVEVAINADSPAQWEEFTAAVSRQKADYLAACARTPERILGESQRDEPAANGDALSGLPGSSGVVEGPVFLVLSQEDFAKFPKGSVLVARTTNPTWTPLFYSAVGVITESGGPLSHGAVTAREMHIPAVMSVRGCLSRLKNGQRVRVDGAAGRVSLL